MKLKIIEMIPNNSFRTRIRIFNKEIMEFTENNEAFNLSIVEIIDGFPTAYILYKDTNKNNILLVDKEN